MSKNYVVVVNDLEMQQLFAALDIALKTNGLAAVEGVYLLAGKLRNVVASQGEVKKPEPNIKTESKTKDKTLPVEDKKLETVKTTKKLVKVKKK